MAAGDDSFSPGESPTAPAGHAEQNTHGEAASISKAKRDVIKDARSTKMPLSFNLEQTEKKKKEI